MSAVPAIEPAVILTPREKQCLDELLKDGASNQTIAKRLFVSENTVKSHMKTLLNKTRKPQRTALVVAVMRDEMKVFVQPSPEN